MKWTGNLSLVEKLHVVGESARFMGPLATTRRVLEHILAEKPARLSRFDRLYGTDTSGSVQPVELGIDDDDTRQHAVQYLPSPAHITRRLIANLRIDPRQWSFVDFGCGKGRVALVAAELGFRQVHGIEISPSLQRIAVANVKRFQQTHGQHCDVDIQLGDARDAVLPAGDTVLHFYHPFGAPVLRAVLANVEKSLETQPRRIRVAYLAAFDEPLAVLDATPWLRRDRFVRCIEAKYSFATYVHG